MKKMYNEVEDSLTYLHDINYFLPYLSEKEYNSLVEIKETIEKFRKKCIHDLNTPLIALKNYTEGSCSWERAGMMCDLHIFGLRKYCEDKNVNWRELRIDEYYGVEGKEGIEKIKENWSKLDPNHEFEPIKYNGNSLYTKYPFLEDVSDTEYNYNDANENYIKYKSKMLISEYTCQFYKTVNQFLQKNPEFGGEVNFYLNNMINESLSKLCDGINVNKEEDLQFLELEIDICNDLLKENDLESILKSYYELMDIMIDNYYDYTIDKTKILSKES